MAQIEKQDPIYRTTPESTYKMMAIMLGICIVGGVIFFALWDYWTSMPPAIMGQDAGADDHGGAVTATGVSCRLSCLFLAVTTISSKV